MSQNILLRNFQLSFAVNLRNDYLCMSFHMSPKETRTQDSEVNFLQDQQCLVGQYQLSEKVINKV